MHLWPAAAIAAFAMIFAIAAANGAEKEASRMPVFTGTTIFQLTAAEIARAAATWTRKVHAGRFNSPAAGL